MAQGDGTKAQQPTPPRTTKFKVNSAGARNSVLRRAKNWLPPAQRELLDRRLLPICITDRENVNIINVLPSNGVPGTNTSSGTWAYTESNPLRDPNCDGDNNPNTTPPDDADPPVYPGEGGRPVTEPKMYDIRLIPGDGRTPNEYAMALIHELAHISREQNSCACKAQEDSDPSNDGDVVEDGDAQALKKVENCDKPFPTEEGETDESQGKDCCEICDEASTNCISISWMEEMWRSEDGGCIVQDANGNDIWVDSASCPDAQEVTTYIKIVNDYAELCAKCKDAYEDADPPLEVDDLATDPCPHTLPGLDE